jgi:HEAT repeat protein
MLDQESSVRAAAAAALQRIDQNWTKNEDIPQVVPKIIKALESTEYWVQHSAIKLLELLKIDPANPPQKAPAAAAAGSKSAAETGPHPALAVLSEMLSDRDRDFRLAAAVALGRLREKSAGAILVAAVADSDDAVRQAAETALAALN